MRIRGHSGRAGNDDRSNGVGGQRNGNVGRVAELAERAMEVMDRANFDSVDPWPAGRGLDLPTVNLCA